MQGEYEVGAIRRRLMVMPDNAGKLRGQKIFHFLIDLSKLTEDLVYDYPPSDTPTHHSQWWDQDLRELLFGKTELDPHSYTYVVGVERLRKMLEGSVFNQDTFARAIVEEEGSERWALTSRHDGKPTVLFVPEHEFRGIHRKSADNFNTTYKELANVRRFPLSKTDDEIPIYINQFYKKHMKKLDRAIAKLHDTVKPLQLGLHGVQNAQRAIAAMRHCMLPAHERRARWNTAPDWISSAIQPAVVPGDIVAADNHPHQGQRDRAAYLETTVCPNLAVDLSEHIRELLTDSGLTRPRDEAALNLLQALRTNEYIGAVLEHPAEYSRLEWAHVHDVLTKSFQKISQSPKGLAELVRCEYLAIAKAAAADVPDLASDASGGRHQHLTEAIGLFEPDKLTFPGAKSSPLAVRLAKMWKQGAVYKTHGAAFIQCWQQALSATLLKIQLHHDFITARAWLARCVISLGHFDKADADALLAQVDKAVSTASAKAAKQVLAKKGNGPLARTLGSHLHSTSATAIKIGVAGIMLYEAFAEGEKTDGHHTLGIVTSFMDVISAQLEFGESLRQIGHYARVAEKKHVSVVLEKAKIVDDKVLKRIGLAGAVIQFFVAASSQTLDSKKQWRRTKGQFDLVFATASLGLALWEVAAVGTVVGGPGAWLAATLWLTHMMLTSKGFWAAFPGYGTLPGVGQYCRKIYEDALGGDPSKASSKNAKKFAGLVLLGDAARAKRINASIEELGRYCNHEIVKTEYSSFWSIHPDRNPGGGPYADDEAYRAKLAAVHAVLRSKYGFPNDVADLLLTEREA